MGIDEFKAKATEDRITAPPVYVSVSRAASITGAEYVIDGGTVPTV